MSTLNEAIERLANDSGFRAQLLEDADTALAGYKLSADDRDRLLQQAEMMEAGVQEDPLAATEADHGQSDAAAAKN